MSISATAGSPENRLGVRRAAASAVLFVVLAVAMTWPLALHMTDSTPSSWRDSHIIAYLLAWDAHAIATDPTNLFQANYYHPEPDALAYTDHLLGLALLSAPIQWTTDNPYLAHNIAFVLGIAFAGWATSLLAFELTRHRAASIVAGVAFAFSPYWFGHTINMSHVQAVSSGWIPLTLLGLVRWSRSGHWADIGLATLGFIMATLTSWYQGAFLSVAVLIAAVVFLAKRPVKPLASMAVQGALGIAIVAAIVLPVTGPYRRVAERYPQATSAAKQAAEISAHPSSYLAVARDIRLWGPLTEPFRRRQSSVETTLFPGAALLVLAGTGTVAGIRRRDSRRPVLAFAAVGAAGVLLSLGTGSGFRRYMPWTLLAEHTTAFRALRAPARAHVITLLAMAILAAFGTRALLRRWPRRAAVAAGIVIAILLAEGTSVPLRLGRALRPAPIHRTLAVRPGAVLELPTTYFVGRSVPNETVDIRWMMASTAHWRPIANGVASFKPPSYRVLVRLLATLPDARSLAEIRSRGIRTLVVHTDLLDGTPWEGIERELAIVPGVRQLAQEGPIVVYDIPA